MGCGKVTPSPQTLFLHVVRGFAAHHVQKRRLLEGLRPSKPPDCLRSSKKKSMQRSDYIIRRLGWALFTIIFVVVLNFFMFRVLPGDPAKAGIRDPRLTLQAQQAIRERFGLDKPLVISTTGNPLDSQFFLYFRNLLRGDLGISYNFNRPVSDLLGERLVNTVLLVALGQGLAIVIGLALGVVGMLGLTRVIGGLLYGVQALNPGVIALVVVVLAAVALVATLVPARRAARVSPMVALND